jgi:hypothetical protein
MRRLWPLALIAAAAVALWAPSLFVREVGDSFGYDLNWSAQFSAAFRAGDLYPRWTPDSFDGLGGPTFYFYPPLGFWLAALISLATGGLGAALQLKLAELALFGLSGWSMFAWLRLKADPLPAALGGVLFMLAPYHLDDLYVRGAFAELSAIAVLPLVALGLASTAAGARTGPLWLALGWAGVILGHLPIALVTGVLVIAPYGLWLLWELPAAQRLAFAARAAAALALGTGLAALYLAPALGLQRFISADYWWSANFQASDRLFLNPKAWTMPLEPFFAAIAAGEAGIAAVVGWRAWRGGARAAAVWGAVAVIVFVVIAGLVPGFWSLPLMAKVQFPWRAMALEEFALVTVLIRAPRPALGRLPVICLIALMAGDLAAVGKFLVTGPATAQRAGYGAASFPTSIDAPEYLPAGMLRMTADGPAPAQDIAALARTPLAAGDSVSASASPGGRDVRIRLAPGPARPVTVRRFYFPSWQASCDGRPVPAEPTGPARLVGFTSPTGVAYCDVTIGLTDAEKLGLALSAASLASLAAWVGLRRRTKA